MSNSKGITGKAVKQMLKQEAFLINEIPIAVFEHDDFGSIIRVFNVKENKPDNVFFFLPAPEEDILHFLKVHCRNQLNDSSNMKKKGPLRKVKPQERRAKEAERLKEERHKNKHHSKKIRKKS